MDLIDKFMKPGVLIKLKAEYRICHLFDRQSFDSCVKRSGALYFIDFSKLVFVSYNCSDPPLMYLGPANKKIDGAIPTNNPPRIEPKNLELVLHSGIVWYHMSNKKDNYTLQEIFEVCDVG